MRSEVQLSIPESFAKRLEKNNYTIEIVVYNDNTHSIYVCKDEQDITSKTFNPKLKDSVKDAFEYIHHKLFEKPKKRKLLKA